MATPEPCIPWADRDDRNHPPEPHRCECSCHETLDRLCPEHGRQLPEERPAAEFLDAEAAPPVQPSRVQAFTDGPIRTEG